MNSSNSNMQKGRLHSLGGEPLIISSVLSASAVRSLEKAVCLAAHGAGLLIDSVYPDEVGRGRGQTHFAVTFRNSPPIKPGTETDHQVGNRRAGLPCRDILRANLV